MTGINYDEFQKIINEFPDITACILYKYETSVAIEAAVLRLYAAEVLDIHVKQLAWENQLNGNS